MLRSDSVLSRTRDALEPQVSHTTSKKVTLCFKIHSWMFLRLRRRHVFYLWHLWRRDLQHRCSCNGDADSDPQGLGPQSPVNKQQHAGEAMEVEGAALPDPRDSKRLKRGVRLRDPPSLASEHSFVSGLLNSCCNHEQKRLAAAYRKWIDTVIGQQR